MVKVAPISRHVLAGQGQGLRALKTLAASAARIDISSPDRAGCWRSLSEEAALAAAWVTA